MQFPGWLFAAGELAVDFVSRVCTYNLVEHRQSYPEV